MDPLHQPPRRLIVRKAVGPHSAQTEILEADPDELDDSLGGIAVPLMFRAQAPAKLGLRIAPDP